MSSFCCCCKDEINYNLDDLTMATQILPKKENRETLLQKNELSPNNNYLITFGSVTYGKVIDLNSLLKKPNTKINIKNICFGDLHSLFLFEVINDNDKTNVIYGYGSNQNGELGLQYIQGEKNEYNYLVEINLDDYMDKPPIFWKQNYYYTIEDIGVGNGFSLISIKYKNKDDISLYRFQLKKEDKYDTIIKKTETRKKSIFKEKFNTMIYGNIIQFKCFVDRVLILTNKNYLLMKGTLFNMDIAEDYTIIATFKETILNLHAGINDCLILDDKSNILLVGHGEYGEFGLENTIDLTKKGQYLINDYFNRNNLEINKMSTGARHSLVLCSNGEVYCFGDNSDGQCCGYEKIVTSPVKVKFENNSEFIVDIKAGFNHSIAKSKSGKIFVWGDSTWDKLGFKETRIDQYVPVEVSDMKIRNVIRIFAGPLQSAFFISGGLSLTADVNESK